MIIFVRELNLWRMELYFKDKDLFEIVNDPKKKSPAVWSIKSETNNAKTASTELRCY